mgnify:CR=1 FL=1
MKHIADIISSATTGALATIINAASPDEQYMAQTGSYSKGDFDFDVFANMGKVVIYIVTGDNERHPFSDVSIEDARMFWHTLS